MVETQNLAGGEAHWQSWYLKMFFPYFFGSWSKCFGLSISYGRKLGCSFHAQRPLWTVIAQEHNGDVKDDMYIYIMIQWYDYVIPSPVESATPREKPRWSKVDVDELRSRAKHFADDNMVIKWIQAGKFINNMDINNRINMDIGGIHWRIFTGFSAAGIQKRPI